jgi:predicted 3-demethylubiquinone-9 3-methyltransferase (glyoxalase superfamily)
MQNLSTCLWFEDCAEQAAAFYTGIFPNSRILQTTHYLEGALLDAGSVLTVRFSLDGTEYVALNGGPNFSFTPAISLVAYCDTQEQIDDLWEKLCSEGHAGECGWLTDRYGIAWQIVPRPLIDMLTGADGAAAQRAFSAMMQMTRLDIALLEEAYEGPRIAD